MNAYLVEFRSRHLSWATILWGCLALAGRAQEPAADLVLIGGKLATLDLASPSATALAIRGDRIVAVGSDDQIRARIGPATQIIELQGRLATPGLIEGHGHFLGLGQSKQTLDLSPAKTWDEVVALVAEVAATKPKGIWITGRGWHQSKWARPPIPTVEGYPHHAMLSRRVPDHPVMLTHASGHLCLANAKAMEIADVDRQTVAPPGGQIVADAGGNPAGIFREAAAGLIGRAYARSRAALSPAEHQRERDEAIRLATAECLAKGVTSFHDAGSSFAAIDHFRSLADRRQLQVRLWVMIRESPAALASRLADYRIIDAGNHALMVRSVKLLIDGALGTHGAWLLAPYDDLPQSTGLATMRPETVLQVAELAMKHDFQLCVHAIGDRANREVLSIYEATFRKYPHRTDLRWRIEHAQHLSPQDVPRFRRLGVIAAMQGIHATSDGPFVLERLGQSRAAEGAYVWQSLLKTGAMIVNGSDTPVEDVNPILGFYASVTRRLSNGRQFFAEQRMSRQQALRSYTLDAAYAANEEHLKGSLTPGKLADVVVLSKDILTVPEEEILQARVVFTIVGGKILFRL